MYSGLSVIQFYDARSLAGLNLFNLEGLIKFGQIMPSWVIRTVNFVAFTRPFFVCFGMQIVCSNLLAVQV